MRIKKKTDNPTKDDWNVIRHFTNSTMFRVQNITSLSDSQTVTNDLGQVENDLNTFFQFAS